MVKTYIFLIAAIFCEVAGTMLLPVSQNFTNGFFKFTGGGSAFTDEGSYTDGASANQDTATFTSPADYSAAGYNMSVGVAEGDQNEVATDTVTIAAVKPGAAGATAKVVSLKASSTIISYDAAGSNPSPSSVTLTATSQNFTNGFFKFTGGGGAFSDEGSYTDGTSANGDTATFTSPSSFSASGFDMSVGVAEGDQNEIATDTVTIACIKPGQDGTDGTAANSVNLESTAYIINYDAAGSNPSPSSIGLTATSQNFTNGFFKFTNGNTFFSDEIQFTDGTGANQDTKNSISMPSSYFATPVTITVGVSEASEVQVASDSITVVAVKPGQQGSSSTSDLEFTFAVSFTPTQHLPPASVQGDTVVPLISDLGGEGAVSEAAQLNQTLDKIAVFNTDTSISHQQAVNFDNSFSGVNWLQTHEDGAVEYRFPSTLQDVTTDSCFSNSIMQSAPFFVPRRNGKIKSITGLLEHRNSNTVSSGEAYFQAGLYTISEPFLDGISANPKISLLDKFVFGPLTGTDRGMEMTSSAPVVIQLSGSAGGGTQFIDIVQDQPYFIICWTVANATGWTSISNARSAGNVRLSANLTCVYTEA